jgi:predicted adenine nucleotide alpha hydrolase (AANH) superfamily ATPase
MKILDKIKKINEKKRKNIIKYLNPNIKYHLEFLKKGNHKLISFNENSKEIIVGDYNFYGIYQPFTKLWIWATSIPGVDTKYNKNIKYIKSFSHLFESSNNIKNIFYHQLLTQDVLLVSDEKMIKWINELILYLTDDLWVFNPINSEANTQFITLVNIKEKNN